MYHFVLVIGAVRLISQQLISPGTKCKTENSAVDFVFPHYCYYLLLSPESLSKIQYLPVCDSDTGAAPVKSLLRLFPIINYRTVVKDDNVRNSSDIIF
jgi:hypothetical protein